MQRLRKCRAFASMLCRLGRDKLFIKVPLLFSWNRPGRRAWSRCRRHTNQPTSLPHESIVHASQKLPDLVRWFFFSSRSSSSFYWPSHSTCANYINWLQKTEYILGKLCLPLTKIHPEKRAFVMLNCIHISGLGQLQYVFWNCIHLSAIPRGLCLVG